jgi:hypothetical protein
MQLLSQTFRTSLGRFTGCVLRTKRYGKPHRTESLHIGTLWRYITGFETIHDTATPTCDPCEDENDYEDITRLATMSAVELHTTLNNGVPIDVRVWRLQVYASSSRCHASIFKRHRRNFKHEAGA